MWVNVEDCIKDKVKGIYTILVRQTPKQETQTQSKISNPNKKPKEKRVKAMQQTNWSTKWEDSQEENYDKLSVPSHFKKYTVATRKIVLKQPVRDVPKEWISYDLPEQSKTVNLA